MFIVGKLGGQVGPVFEEFDEGSQNRSSVGFGVLKILFVLPPPAALKIFFYDLLNSESDGRMSSGMAHQQARAIQVFLHISWAWVSPPRRIFRHSA